MHRTEATFPPVVRSSLSGRTTPAIGRRSPPCPADVAERAALIAEGDGLDRATADARALTECGFTGWRDLADAHAAVILAEIDRLPPPCDLVGALLARGAAKLLTGPHWLAAVSAGWTVLDVFGCDGWQPAERRDVMGLAVRAAIHAAPGRRLVAIDDAGADFREADGRTVRFHRPSCTADLRNVVPWWQSPVIVNREAA